MDRRKFINSLLFAAGAAVTGIAFKALAVSVYAEVGKLGYKLKGPKGRQCQDCKHFKKRDVDGECVLMVMKNAHKATEVLVKPEATCVMWSLGTKK